MPHDTSPPAGELNSAPPCHDAIVIGAGFAGMYALKVLRDDLGLDVLAFERGAGVGGTWYWNRYPGARCDNESMFYCYSFDEDLQRDWVWSERYPAQPELLDYANHVADRFDLRRSIRFDTSVESVTYDEERHTWTVVAVGGDVHEARYVLAAVGNLSSSQVPNIPGLERFEGEVLHTGTWPSAGADLAGKRVAVVGTGSSGIQVIPQIARAAAHLTVYQRTPNYSVPAQNCPLEPAERAAIVERYSELRHQARRAKSGTILRPPVGNALELSPEARQAELDRRWQEGGPGFLAAFSDTAVDMQANAVSADYVRDRIRSIVDDPVLAERLSPSGYAIGAKRICVDIDYFETYNRENVDLVDLRATPILEIAPHGIVTADGTRELDAIVFATGFDALTGSLLRLGVTGRGGVRLQDKWRNGPSTYLGLMTEGFPNLFLLTGPGSPAVLGNVMVAIEQHVEWVADYLRHLAAAQVVATEPTEQDEACWTAHVGDVGAESLYSTHNSWLVGANIPGKPRVFMAFAGGMDVYRDICDSVAADGYRGFKHELVEHHEDPARAGVA